MVAAAAAVVALAAAALIVGSLPKAQTAVNNPLLKQDHEEQRLHACSKATCSKACQMEHSWNLIRLPRSASVQRPKYWPAVRSRRWCSGVGLPLISCGT